MSAPKISVVTPTGNRAPFLALVRERFLAQTETDSEWLVLDDSAQPDPLFATQHDRITYLHTTETLSIGEKRNRLIAQARGEVIVQFDDDDFYADNYLATCLTVLDDNDAGFMNLRRFFLCDTLSRFWGYWDITDGDGVHFEVRRGSTTTHHFGAGDLPPLSIDPLAYGFGYAFRRRVWEASPFPDRDWGEDTVFAKAAAGQFKCIGMEDTGGLCMHFLHPQSTSKCFPQFRLPENIISQHFNLDTLEMFISAGRQ